MVIGYHIYSAIRQGLSLCRMTTSNYTSSMNLCYNTILTVPNNPKDLDPSYKTDLDFWDCFGRKKNSVL